LKKMQIRRRLICKMVAKKTGAKKIKAYFCPKCKSVNVHHPLGIKNLWGVIPKWKCRDCGFTSGMFPMGIVDKSKLEGKKK
jgi:hypothetical protein